MGIIQFTCTGCESELGPDQEVVKFKGARFHVLCYTSYQNGVKSVKDADIITALRNVVRAWEKYEDAAMIEPYIQKARELVWPNGDQ